MSSDFGVQTFLFVWVCSWACGVSSLPAMPQKARVAVSDINVLMFGVLQFGESLHQMYQNTEDKLARLTRTISHTDKLVQRLNQDTEQAAQSERQIKEQLSFIQAQMTSLHFQAQETNGLVNKVEQEDEALKQKVTYLEAKLSSLTPDNITALKETTLKHNTQLENLICWTMKQKKQLEKQKQQLADLQKQTNGSS